MATPKGAVPAYSLYGQPANNMRLNAVADARIAAPSAPYVGRGNKCVGNDDTCEGSRAKGTEYCMGHLRSKVGKKVENTDGTNEANEG
jgi:hypothetical protein